MWWLKAPLKFCNKIELLLLLLLELFVLFSVFIIWLFKFNVLFADAVCVNDAVVVRVSGILKWFKLELFDDDTPLFWNRVNMLFVCWWLGPGKRWCCCWLCGNDAEFSDCGDVWLVLVELANSFWSRNSWSIFLLVAFFGFLFVVDVVCSWYWYWLGDCCWLSFVAVDFLDDLDFVVELDCGDFFRFVAAVFVFFAF